MPRGTARFMSPINEAVLVNDRVRETVKRRKQWLSARHESPERTSLFQRFFGALMSLTPDEKATFMEAISGKKKTDGRARNKEAAE